MSVCVFPFGPRPTFLGNDGKPLSSGTVTFYAAGSASKQDTFSDEGLTILNPNPITFNSAGRTSVSGTEVNVYPSATTYKIVVADSTGTTVYTSDRIEPCSAVTSLTVLSNHGVVLGTGSTGLSSTAAGGAGLPLIGAGASADPTFTALKPGGGGVAVLTVTLTDGATPALDASLGTVFRLAAAGNRTIAIPSNPTPGQKIVIQMFASGGARTLSLNTGAGGFRFGSDTTALTQTSSGKTDYIGAIWNDTDSFWDVVAYDKGH